MPPTNFGLYVHIPFCRTKCPYCAFDSAAGQDYLIDDYIDAVCDEIAARPPQFKAFDTVYFGGGTPGMLSGDQINRLTEFIRSELFIQPDAEMTIEVNPGDVNMDKARFLVKEAGFNRISIGVQSFEQNELEFLGRRHDAEEAINAVEDCRSTGAKISLDLIQGLPGQDLKARTKSLEKAVSLGAHHISVYELAIDEGSVFFGLKQAGQFPAIQADAVADGYLHASKYLRRHGYVHYEVSNYSLGPDNMSKHNSRYWKSLPWLGVGASAHSFDGDASGPSRWWNVKGAPAYIQQMKDTGSAIAGRELLTAEQRRLERIALGFRFMGGVAMDDLLDPNRDEYLKKLKSEGLVLIRENRVHATIEGFLIADGLARVLSGSGT